MRRLTVFDVASVAQVYRLAYDMRLPWLAGRHTPEEDLAFFSTHVFPSWDLFGVFTEDRLAGFIALRPGWVEQLYVLPAQQGQGIGSRLLRHAQAMQAELLLWTFERNGEARQFYEHHGFVAQKFTDGSENKEGEPDVLYAWRRPAGPRLSPG